MKIITLRALQPASPECSQSGAFRHPLEQQESSSSRKRSHSLEKWLKKTLHVDDDADVTNQSKEHRKAEKARRRRVRHNTWRRLVGLPPKPMDELPGTPVADDEEMSDVQLRSDTNHTTSNAEITPEMDTELDLEFPVIENPEDDDESLEGMTPEEEDSLLALLEARHAVSELLPELEPTMVEISRREFVPARVQPPVYTPQIYLQHDRRGGMIISGRMIIFTHQVFTEKRDRYIGRMLPTVSEERPLYSRQEAAARA